MTRYHNSEEVTFWCIQPLKFTDIQPNGKPRTVCYICEGCGDSKLIDIYDYRNKKYKNLCRTCALGTDTTRLKMVNSRKSWLSDHPEYGDEHSKKIVKFYEDHPEVGEQHSQYLKELYKTRPELKYLAGNGQRGKSPTKETRKLQSEVRSRYLKEHPEAKVAISCFHQGIDIEDFTGFVTPERKKFRCSLEYGLWRISVFERDNYTCQECGKRNCEINGHHILPIRDYPDVEYSLNIDNGVTLCVDCHKKVNGKEYEFSDKYFDKILK